MKKIVLKRTCLALVILLALSGLVTADNSSAIGHETEVITETQWIGVNTDAISGAIQAATIGIYTNLLTVQDGQTKWIGQNTQYITDVVQTATIEGAPTTITTFPNIQIIGPTDGDGLPTGPFDLIIAPVLAAQIQDLAKEFCPRMNEAEECSPDFQPRLQSLMKAKGTVHVLSTRGASSPEVILFLGMAAWVFLSGLVAKAVKKFHSGDLPFHLHVDHENPPIVTYVTIATSFVMTLTKDIQPSKNIQPTKTDIESPESSSTQEPDSCWLYVGAYSDDLGDDVNNDELIESLRKRDLPFPVSPNSIRDGQKTTKKTFNGIAGRIALPISTSHAISKRAQAKMIDKIGNCDKDKYPVLKTFRRVKEHPMAKNVMRAFSSDFSGLGKAKREHGLNPTTWWFIPKQPLEQFGNPCYIATLQQRGRRDETDPDTSTNNFPLPYDQTSHSAAKRLTVDHIYETSTLESFFTSELSSPDDSRCGSFVQMFDRRNMADTYTGNAAGEVKSRFQSLWEQNSNPLPGNWAFAGVDHRINSLKGNMLNPALGSWPGLKDIDRDVNGWDNLFQIWNNAGMSLEFINTESICTYFSERNGAIYKALNDFDDIHICETQQHEGDTSMPTIWADAYKNYMINLLQTNELLIQGRIAQIRDIIADNEHRLLTDSGLRNRYGAAYLNLMNRYPIESFTFRHSCLLKWEASNDAHPGIIARAPKPDRCKLHLPKMCIVATYIDCLLQFENRPDIPFEECPPTPHQDFSCGTPAIETRAAEVPTAPVVPYGYCIQTHLAGTCTLAMSYRDGTEDGEEMGDKATVYDHTCKELGSSKNVKQGLSITSILPYPVRIDYYDKSNTNQGFKSFLDAKFTFGKMKVVQIQKDNRRCETTQYSSPPSFVHVVLRCNFDCSKEQLYD